MAADTSARDVETEDQPLWHGHRDRLRQRYLAAGGEALADYELVELLLFLGIPRCDVKPLAKELVARFRNFAGVVTADLPALMQVKGMSENAAIALKLVRDAAQRLARQQAMDRPVLGNWQAVLDYVQITMAHETREQFRLLFLDRRNALIADELQQRGTIDHTPVYPREVVRRALELGATAIILVQNLLTSQSPRISAGFRLS